MFGQNVDGANALLLMAHRFFAHIAIEARFRQQRCAGPPQIVDGERLHVERQPLQRLVERIAREWLPGASPARRYLC